MWNRFDDDGDGYDYDNEEDEEDFELDEQDLKDALNKVLRENRKLMTEMNQLKDHLGILINCERERDRQKEKLEREKNLIDGEEDNDWSNDSWEEPWDDPGYAGDGHYFADPGGKVPSL